MKLEGLSQGQELSSEGMGDLWEEGEAHSCWQPSESWGQLAFKTCDLSGDTGTLSPNHTRGKRSCWLLRDVIYFLALQMFIEHF